jgi:hypothetical protein
MRSATRAEIITGIRQQGTAHPTRLHLGKIRPIASLAEIATVFDGFREVHVAEHHSEIAACDWLEARGIHPVARHRLITIALSKDGARRAGITHLPDNTVRVRVYTLASRKG